MVLVEYWGFGVRHIQLLLLVICGMVGAILSNTLDTAMYMVENDTNTNNFTLFDDLFRQKVKSWTFEQKYILKNGPTVFRFLASLFAGLSSTRWNLKYSLLINFAVLSLQSYLIPIITNKLVYDYLLAVVLLQGFCYGMIDPLTTAILARWTPYMEVGRTCTLVFSCKLVGYFFIYVLGVFLQTSLGGWHTLFYIVGNLGMLWCVAWFTFGFQDPKKCFYLSLKEKEFIVNNIRYLSSASYVHQPIPWRGIFTCTPIYAALISELSNSWLYEMLTSTSLSADYFHLYNNFSSTTAMTLRYVVPTGVPISQFIAALVVDMLIGKARYPLSFIRKTSNTIGCWGSSLALLWLCYDPNGLLEPAAYFFIIYLNIFISLGSKLVYYDVTRDYSGLLQGLVGFVAFIPLAFFIPIMESNLDPKSLELADDSNFQGLWYACAATMFLGNFVFIILKTRNKKLETEGRSGPRLSIASKFGDW